MRKLPKSWKQETPSRYVGPHGLTIVKVENDIWVISRGTVKLAAVRTPEEGIKILKPIEFK